MPPKAVPSPRVRKETTHEHARGNTRPRVRSSHSASRATPSSSTPLEKKKAPCSGVFVYINGLLCRTADSTGQFCPSDVFAGIDRPPACASFPVPSLKKNGVPDTFLRAAADANRDADSSFESECLIFSTFGVLTGGVLIDPFHETFADYTQTAPYTVTGITPSVHRALAPSEEQRREVEEVRDANELAFSRGDFARIRPESALTLCTSELTLPPPAPVPLASPLSPALAETSAPAIKRTTSYPAMRRRRFHLTSALVDEWYDNLAVPRGVTPKETEGHKTAWQEAEAFRQLLMNNSVSRAVEPQNFLPPSIPFLYRERGAPVHVKDDVEGKDTGRGYDAAAVDAELKGDTPPLPLPGVRSAAAAFVCYSGQPRFTSSGVNSLRPTAVEQRTPSVPVRLQKRLRPFKGAEIAREASRKKTERQSPRNPSAVEVRDGAAGGDEVGQDAKEYFLIPYRTVLPRVAAFRLFWLYFNHLGLLYNGTRITGETNASSVQELLRTGDYGWGLCPDAEYTVAAEVQRKRQITRALWSKAGETFPGGTRWSTAGGNHRVVSAAFTALMTSDRDALLRRIHVLNVFLHELCKEAPEPV
ncbi:hypothetical protein ABB37_04299 [Leptomonas pyrrhocoris]|uniref:Uncharacterized protein n=1 Tax=Leptomonas pyrrhocoris TaxID=157538 RepID=A0A0N0VFF2_LEPPY|nr:hypothetical protein ABB37_04299 [Leptomonas pyrrhocoris]KPA80894.1 hypothetical protein ABB37_04299 [Leptomonas pyrrhocoris]|eukprot:XP_015659333.1 hypothetical protein ABB37_04299 [Leptomonas pyrrhocoris]